MNYDDAQRGVQPLLSDMEYNQAVPVGLNNDIRNNDGGGNEFLPYGITNNSAGLPPTQTQVQTQVQTQSQVQSQVHTQNHIESESQIESQSMTRPTSDMNVNPTSGQPSSKPTTTYPVVEVVAPENLNAGYTFDAMVGGRVLTVVVPRKGVVKGQVFEAQTQAPMDESPEFLSVPQGFWKDGFFDFCRLGPMHPSIVLAVCCPLLALGQITTRLGLKWNGEPTSEPKQIKLTFLIFLFLTVLRMFLSSWYILIYSTYVVLIVARVRSHMRKRYSLPPTVHRILPHDNPRCGFSEDRYVVEDYCLPLVCSPCTISQMGRHTAMYETYEGAYFSSTGLPPHVPLMV